MPVAVPPVIVDDEDPDDEWNLSEWLELMADRKPGGPAVFSQQNQQATEVILVPARKARSCMRQMCGYSIANHTTFLLERPEVPVEHPWYRHLWADSASVEFVTPIGNEDEPALDGNGDPIPDQYLPKKGSDSFVNYGPEYTGNYAWAHVTVQFRHYRWRVWADWDVTWEDWEGEEWRRLVANSQTTPRLELIETSATEEGKVYFMDADAGGSTSPAIGPSGRATDGSVYIRKQITGYEIVWKAVEEQYLTGEYQEDIDGSLILPKFRRLSRYQGAVNSVEFLGHPAGTLLFAGFKTVPYPFAGVRTNYDFGLIAHDVYMTFDQIDPPRPANVEDWQGNPIATPKRGWLTFPYRPNENHYWFAATAGDGTTRGTADGKYIAEELNFYDLFRHPDDPAYPLPT